MNIEFKEMLNTMNVVYHYEESIVSFLIKSIEYLDEETFNELNMEIKNILLFSYGEQCKDDRHLYVRISSLMLSYNTKTSKKFRYRVFSASKSDIRYRYFLRLCFNYYFKFRNDIERTLTTMEKIFKYYDPSHEGYKDMKKKMLEYRLENREEFAYEF